MMSEQTSGGAFYANAAMNGAAMNGAAMNSAASIAAVDRLGDGVLTRRVLAWWADVVLIAILSGIAWLLLATFGVLTLGLGFPLLSLLPVLPVLYNVGFLASDLQATPGQAMFGLIVARDEDLGRPNLAQALISTLGYYLTLAVFFLLLGLALVTTRHRTLHDLAAGLVVVRRGALDDLIGASYPGSPRP
jgi:uncharacterized RDD family membrane protein YckC